MEKKQEWGPDFNSDWVHGKIDLLAPPAAPPVRRARARLENRIQEKEQTMGNRLFGQKYYPAWITLLVVGLLVVSFSFPQVRVAANNFLGLFRVESIEAVKVGFSLENMPEEMETQFRALDSILSSQLKVDEEVSPVEAADAAEASQLAGFDIRIPAAADGEVHYMVQQASAITMTIDREQWQAFIDGLGYPDFILPESTDGAEVIFNIPDAVVMGIGDCRDEQVDEVENREIPDCTVFMQSGAPTVEAPPEIDIDRAGQVMLQALGMSEEDAVAFSRRVNWATTLVVPVPAEADFREVTVDGVRGIFLEDEYSRTGAIYSLVWVRDGMLYALTGSGSLEDALALGDSLE